MWRFSMQIELLYLKLILKTWTGTTHSPSKCIFAALEYEQNVHLYGQISIDNIFTIQLDAIMKV